MGYDFKRLVYGALLFTGTMYLLISMVGILGNNYGKDMDELGGGELFNSDVWEVGTDDRYQEASGIRNASIDASVTDLDKPTSSKSLFEQIGDFVLLPFNLFFTTLGVLFSVPGPIMFILSTLLVIELMLVIWRLLKVGD